MITTAVENEENRPRCVMHQALQKLDKDSTVDSALGHHETHVAPRTHRRDHIDRTPLPRAPHHRRLALDPPRRPRVTVRSHPGFVAKVDIRPDFPSLSANPRVLLLQPPPHSFRVLLEGPEQRSLACQPELFQQPPYTGHAQLQVPLLPQQNPDHLPSPERKLEPELQRTLAGDRTIQPAHLGGLDLHRPTLQGPGLQRTPTPAAVSCKPCVNAASRKAQRLDHGFWALARLHSFHRTNPNLLQRLMVEGTSVTSFHVRHCNLCILTYEHINNTILEATTSGFSSSAFLQSAAAWSSCPMKNSASARDSQLSALSRSKSTARRFN